MKQTISFKNAIFVVVFALGGILSYGQEQPKVFGRTIDPAGINPANGKIRCATNEYEAYLKEQDPGRASRAEFEAWLAPKIEAAKLRRQASPDETNSIITIPIVVHVIHNGDAIGSSENIADGQVLSQITVLNQDFRRMFGTPGYNENPVGADMEIQFALAQVDPDGNPTTGIDRVNLGMASWNESNVENTLKPSTIWDPSQYFNIWVCNFGGDLNGVLGYAQFPNTNSVPGIGTGNGGSTTDGLIIGYRYFGSETLYPLGNYEWPYNEGRTSTHEIGHCFGLIHISGDNFSCTVNGTDSQKDYCPDTPATNDYNYECSVVDTCPVAAGFDMIENYMDYTNDTCMNIFTQNQKNRMLGVLASAPRRASLTTSDVWLAKEEFTALSGINVYPNPANDVLNITASNGELPENYTIHNSLGQVIASAKISTEADLSINTAGYSSGIYFIKVNKGNQSKTLKFVKN